MSKIFPEIVRKLVPFQSQQIRYLPRWSHRRPVRVIPAEEYDITKDRQIQKPKINITEQNRKINCDKSKVTEQDGKLNWDKPKIKEQNGKINWDKSRSTSQRHENEETETLLRPKTKIKKPLSISKNTQTNKGTVDMLETIIDERGNFVYTKMKDNDSRISSILVEVKSKKEKEKKDLILLEGKRLIKDALDARCKLEYIIFSRMDEVEYLRPSLPKLGAKLYKMPYREMQLWSDLTTTPGIMGIFKTPDLDCFTPLTDTIPMTIICDNVREPNNLGAILRTCSGVGCQNVILTKGCVNVWDTKVLRSAAGAHFKLRITRKLNWNEIKEKLPQGSNIYIADNRKINTGPEDNPVMHNVEEIIKSVPVVPYYGVDFGMVQHIVLIIGGETEGISAESYQLASECKGVRLHVPLSNNVDSLNTGTAFGIIAFEVKRQFLKYGDVECDYLSSKG